MLEAFREATSSSLDVQLKILQSLPSLLQNYAGDLKGDLLAATLNVCTVLQSSKNGIVNNTAAATLQQLVVAVFDKVVAEDSTLIISKLWVLRSILILEQKSSFKYRQSLKPQANMGQCKYELRLLTPFESSMTCAF